MAQAFANIMANGSVEAFSAGSQPSGKINPRAIRSMAEIGYDLSTHKSTALTEIPEGPYDHVVSMGCGEKCPWVLAHERHEWDIPDPRNMDMDEFRLVRDLIRTKVKELLAEIGRSNDQQ